MNDEFQTLLEPFRIRAVEPLPLLSRSQREQALSAVEHCVADLPEDAVTIDLQGNSDPVETSGAGLRAGAGPDSETSWRSAWHRLVAWVRDQTGVAHVCGDWSRSPTEVMVEQVISGPGQVVLANQLSRGAKSSVERLGGVSVDLPIPQAFDGQSRHGFKGNIDLRGLDAALNDYGARVALVVLSLSNHTSFGHPVSVANLHGAAALCRIAGVPLFIDATRFAENAWLVAQREPRYRGQSMADITRTMFERCDGVLIGLGHRGGVIGTHPGVWTQRLQRQGLDGDRPPGFGGRPLAAVVTRLTRSVDPVLLRYRTDLVQRFAGDLARAGLPVVRPPNGHAVYIDAGALLPQIAAHGLPARALVNELYLEGGVRGVDVGAVASQDEPCNLVQLAVPALVYTRAHLDYVVEVARRIAAHRTRLTAAAPQTASTRTPAPSEGRVPAKDAARPR